MKKILALLTVVMVVVFVGCGKEKEVKTTEKVYVIGTNAEYPPFEYLENSKIVGLDPDIMEEFSKRMGFQYKWANMNFDGLISALQTRKVDIVIAGMSISDERKKYINFSTPYISPAMCYIALKTSPMTIIEDLENKRFGIELGTTEEDIVKKVPGAVIVPFSGHTAALFALKSGKIDSMLLDATVAKKYLENNPDLKTVVTVEGENKAMAFNIEDVELKDKFDKVLKEMMEDGTIDKLKAKYGI